MSITPTIVARTQDRLGESPLWHVGEQALYWIDVYGPTVHRMRLGREVESWKIAGAKFVGSLAFACGGRLILALDTGLVLFDPATGAHVPFCDPNESRDGVIYNDSKVDTAGRLWVGTLDLGETEPRGILYCVDGRGHATVGDSGFVVCNGPAFSPEGDVLYFSDSLNRRLLAYDMDPLSRRLKNRRVFASMGPDDGIPDGLTVDAEGGLWCAHYGIGRLTRFAPDGKVIATLDMPCPVVTSMSFGGPDLKTLFVTTGWSIGIERAEDEPGPGGSLLALYAGCAGREEPEMRASGSG